MFFQALSDCAKRFQIRKVWKNYLLEMGHNLTIFMSSGFTKNFLKPFGSAPGALCYNIILIPKLQSIRKKYILDYALYFYIGNIYVSFSLFFVYFYFLFHCKKKNQITAKLKFILLWKKWCITFQYPFTNKNARALPNHWAQNFESQFWPSFSAGCREQSWPRFPHWIAT